MTKKLRSKGVEAERSGWFDCTEEWGQKKKRWTWRALKVLREERKGARKMRRRQSWAGDPRAWQSVQSPEEHAPSGRKEARDKRSTPAAASPFPGSVASFPFPPLRGVNPEPHLWQSVRSPSAKARPKPRQEAPTPVPGSAWLRCPRWSSSATAWTKLEPRPHPASRWGRIQAKCELLSRVRLCDPVDAWNSPGKNTGGRSLSLRQEIFPTRGLNPGLPHCRQILYQMSHKGSRFKQSCPWNSTASGRLRRPGKHKALGSGPRGDLPSVLPEYSGNCWLREREGRWKEKKQRVPRKIFWVIKKGETFNRANIYEAFTMYVPGLVLNDSWAFSTSFYTRLSRGNLSRNRLQPQLLSRCSRAQEPATTEAPTPQSRSPTTRKAAAVRSACTTAREEPLFATAREKPVL